MTLTAAQTELAEEHLGKSYASAALRGEAVAFFDGGHDTILLVCKSPDGPFVVRQPLPVEEEELARREAEADKLADEERVAQAELEGARLEEQRQAANAEFVRRFATFLDLDPEDETAISRLRDRLRAL